MPTTPKRSILSFLETLSVAPIISLFYHDSWVQRFKKVSYIVVPFYEIWDHNNLREVVGHKDIHDFLHFDGPVGLSSIGPDDYVVSEAYFSDFVRLSTENNFDFVIAWDVPTYADWPAELSWENAVYGLEQIRRLVRQGIEVIGLLNGNSRTQFEKCADSLISMGVDSVAVHASDYLRHRKDYLLAGLLHDSVKTAISRFSRTLIVGATDPYLIKHEGKDLFPNVSVCGFSWFIDAQNGLAYSIRGRVNTYENDALCSCPHCSTREPSVISRSVPDRVLHNFLVVENSIEGETFPSLETSDIVHRGQKLVMASDIHLGTKESLLLRFIEMMRRERPETLVLVGDTSDFTDYDPQLLHDHAKSFFRLLFDIGCEVYPVFGARDRSNHRNGIDQGRIDT